LHLGDLLQLLAGDRADLLLARLVRARALLLLRVETEGLLDEHRRGRGLEDEAEGAVLVDRDDHRDDERILGLGLRGSVELLAELHDVDAVLAERRTHGRGGVRLACRDLELDLPRDLLCHPSHSWWSERGCPLPPVVHCAFSTCMKSSSTGVARPKIDTSTRRRPLSGFTSSTVPLNPENGPSVTRTLSPFSNWTLGLGLSVPSEICEVSRSTS